MTFVCSFDETLDAWYYFNFKNGATQWHHPLDSVYKERVEAARKEGAKVPEGNFSETEVPTEFSEDKHGVEVERTDDKESEKSRDETTINAEPLSDYREVEEEADKCQKTELVTTSDIEKSDQEPSEGMEGRGRLAPLGSLGGARKGLPPLKKLAPLGSQDKMGSFGSLDKPMLGTIDKQRSVESPAGLDRPVLGSPVKGRAREPAGREGGRRQSSLESLGWKPPVGREEGLGGSPASSLLSASSLGSRGSFLKHKKEQEPEDEEEEEEEDEESLARVKGILRGSPAEEGDQREGSR